MKIQFIAKNETRIKTTHTYSYAPLGAPRTFDEFDINIISLQDETLWENNSNSTLSVNDVNDLRSLKVSIENSNQSNIIVLLPQNYSFKYNGGRGHYNCSKKMKDELSSLKHILSYLIPEHITFKLVYEISSTQCGSDSFDSEFHFENNEHYKALTKNTGANCPTTIEVDHRFICTTLALSNNEKSIDSFLIAIGLDNKKAEIPEWLKGIDIYDDQAQKAIIEDAQKEINELQEKINEAERKLAENLFYKSILYETGNNLVKAIAKMLEHLTTVSLAEFVDKKKEDFKISLPTVTFIGEIKGINSNVKNENIWQLDNHCLGYLDVLQEAGTIENVKGLLIINPFRNKPLDERESVHQNQIALAERNGSLIITTEVFLLLFSSYLGGSITREEVIELLKSKIGILRHSDFIKS